MKKEDRFIPVITIVVYYGEKPWDGAVSLHGMLKIPTGLEFGLAENDILERLQKKLGISRSKAKQYFDDVVRKCPGK